MTWCLMRRQQKNLPRSNRPTRHTGRARRDPCPAFFETIMSRKGKIARLPSAVREELNRRLLEGQSGAKILPWLNGLPEVSAVLEEDFEGLRVTDQNLSEWRKGGYQDWLRRRQRVDHTRDMAEWSLQLARAGGGNLSDGAASILAGQILEVLEKLDELVEAQSAEGDDPKKRLGLLSGMIDGLTLAVTRLRKGDQNAAVLQQNARRLDQADESLQLEREKFQRTTCELFLKWREDQRARTISEGPGTNEEKIEQLGQAMFGDLWKAK